jgi:hypothetical protein
MVRYAVGYRSRAFVTFGAPIPVAAINVHSRSDVLELTRLVRAHRRALQGAADGDVRRRDAAVDHPARSRSAHRRAGRRARARGARISARQRRQVVDEAADRSKRAASSSPNADAFRVRERTVLRYYARTIEHLLVTPAGRTTPARTADARTARRKPSFHLVAQAPP